MKKMLSLLLALALVFSLAACGSTGAPAPAEPTAAPAEEEAAPVESLLGTQPVTITFWHCASDEAGVLMDKYIEEFNSTNEYGITVNAVYQGQYSDASTLLKAIISGGNFEELPDLMQLDATGKMTYYNSGKAFTVDQAVAAYAEPGCLDTYLSAALANWQFAGSQLGLPFATSTTVSYYNMDLLKEAGWDKVPETFDDVIRLYQDMQAKGLTQKVLQTVPNTPTLANWLGQLGSYVVNEKNGSEGTATELACIDNGALAAFLTPNSNYDQALLLRLFTDLAELSEAAGDAEAAARWRGELEHLEPLSIDPENGTTVCSKTGFFDEILPMEEIESISVGGVVVPLA